MRLADRIAQSPTVQDVLACRARFARYDDETSLDDDVFYVLRDPLPDGTPVLEARPFDLSGRLGWHESLLPV